MTTTGLIPLLVKKFIKESISNTIKIAIPDFLKPRDMILPPNKNAAGTARAPEKMIRLGASKNSSPASTNMHPKEAPIRSLAYSRLTGNANLVRTVVTIMPEK